MSTNLKSRTITLQLLDGVSVKEFTEGIRLSEASVRSMTRRNLLEYPMLYSCAEVLAKRFGDDSVDEFIKKRCSGDWGVISDVNCDHLKSQREPVISKDGCINPACGLQVSTYLLFLNHGFCDTDCC